MIFCANRVEFSRMGLLSAKKLEKRRKNSEAFSCPYMFKYMDIFFVV